MRHAVISKYECTSCGNVITTRRPLLRKGTKHQFKLPSSKCSCGAGKDNFRLLEFRQAEAVYVDKEKERGLIVPRRVDIAQVKQIVNEQLNKQEGETE